MLGTDVNKEHAISKLMAIALSLCAWTGQYKLLGLCLSTKAPEWRCRIVTFIHGLLVTVLAYYSQMIEGPCMLGIEPGIILGLFFCLANRKFFFKGSPANQYSYSNHC